MIALTLMLLSGCNDYELNPWAGENQAAEPLIEVEPTVLDFGTPSHGETVERSFVIRSLGVAPLHVDGLDALGDGFEVVGSYGHLTILPGEEVEVAVTFTPPDGEARDGTVPVLSDDPGQPEIPVFLQGRGRVPALVVSPDAFDFGDVKVGCPEDVALTLENVGDDTLVIDELGFDTDPQLSLTDLPLWTLAPGESTEVSVRLAATAPGDIDSELTVWSNDPTGPASAFQGASLFEQGPRTDAFSVPADPPVDILFAIDRSLSMNDDAESLGQNFAALADALADVSGDWRIGVVTSDDGCFAEGVLSPSTPDLADRFAAAVTSGSPTGDTERLFLLADRALDRSAPGDCNAGFKRPGAPVHVIAVADEPERSPELSPGYTWDYWVNRMAARLGDPDGLTISGVIDTEGCAQGGGGYLQAISATGGEALSICSGEWSERIHALADATLVGTRRFPVSGTPILQTLAVTVDGAPTNAWMWDPVRAEVIMDVVEPGQHIDVTYEEPLSCP